MPLRATRSDGAAHPRKGCAKSLPSTFYQPDEDPITEVAREGPGACSGGWRRLVSSTPSLECRPWLERDLPPRLIPIAGDKSPYHQQCRGGSTRKQLPPPPSF